MLDKLSKTKFLLNHIQKRQYSTEETFTHTDQSGKAKMIDVGDKATTRRSATASATIHVGSKIAELIRENNIKKGDVLSVAQLAGIMSAKKTSEIIPLCHALPLNSIKVEAKLKGDNVFIEATVNCDGKTGVEMEALTAVTVSALTVYDMCKAVSHDMIIGDIKLLRKTGGSRGDFYR